MPGTEHNMKLKLGMLTHLTHINRISIMALKLPVPAQIVVTTHSPTNLLNFGLSAVHSLHWEPSVLMLTM